MGLCEKEPIKVIYHSATFGDIRRSGSGDILYIVCHGISQDHVARPSLVAIDTASVEIQTFLQIRLFYCKCGISLTVYAPIMFIVF